MARPRKNHEPTLTEHDGSTLGAMMRDTASVVMPTDASPQDRQILADSVFLPVTQVAREHNVTEPTVQAVRRKYADAYRWLLDRRHHIEQGMAFKAMYGIYRGVIDATGDLTRESFLTAEGTLSVAKIRDAVAAIHKLHQVAGLDKLEANLLGKSTESPQERDVTDAVGALSD